MLHKTIICSIWIVCLIIISPCFGNDLKLQLTSEEMTWLNQDHTVRVRIGSAPPFMLTDGKIRGMAIDYLTYIFNQHGIKIQYIQESEVTWPQALKYIEKHDVVDMVPTAMITDVRKKRMIFTDEYLFAPWVIFTRSKADFISSLEDLKGKTVSVEEGYVIHEKLRRDYPEIKLKIVSAKLPNYAEIPVKDLSSGLVDAYVGNLIMTTYMIQSKGYTNIKVAAPTPFGNHNQAMAMRSDWPELASIINKTLAGMTPDEHATILNRWLSIRYEYGISKLDILKWVFGISLFSIIIIVIIMLWNKRLRKEVTMRKQVEKALVESEMRLDFALEMSHTGAWDLNLLDHTSHRTLIHDRIFGYETLLPEWTFEMFLEHVHPEDRSDVEQRFNQATANATDWKFECRIRPFNSEERWIWAVGGHVKNQEGQSLWMTGIVQDITERKRAEEDLRRSEIKYRSMMESLTDQLYICSPEFTVEYMNPAMTKRLGRDAIGEACHKALHGLNHRCDWCIFDKVINGKTVETTIISPLDGRHYRVTNMPIQNKNGTISKMSVFRDITQYIEAVAEKNEAQTQLRHAQKMESIGILAGGIAHDFNNILYPIIGFTELSILDLPKTHQVQENLQDILDGAKRARELVKQILQFSRQEKQTLQPNSLKPVVEEVIKLLKTTIPANIDIQGYLYDGEDHVLCDTTEIHEIVMNLCTNAYHSMEENGGTIIVRLNKQSPSPDLNLPSEEHICLSVSDNGVGIPEEIIDKIFEPYLTTKEIGKGSGLGLSVVHGIVMSYKGNISVKSSPGEGSDFNVFLPITTQSRTVEQKMIKSEPMGGTENILFVDDEAGIVKLATQILERLGYTITGKTSCIEALELFTENPDGFDLVITDMAMPIMTGTEFAIKVLKIHPDIPIIICTGFSENLDVKIAKSIGIKEYIKKPILLDELASKIRKVLDQSSKG